MNDVFKFVFINLYVYIFYNVSILYGDILKEFGYNGIIWCYWRGIGVNC